MSTINPFKYGVAVTGKHFTNREEEIKTITLDLISGQNIILYSPRRFGKTSLILEVMARLKKEGCLCVYVDLFPISSKKRFAEKLASAITKDTSKRFEDVVSKIKNFKGKEGERGTLINIINIQFSSTI